ncbi:Protein of unknown function [Lactobacillus delbrueckii subsp. bulgaricus]|nr:Protein of unknown function [Lactobacillus delbrueckii subsp. bulgaricus]
MTYSKVFVVDD